MSRELWLNLPVREPERAKEFYKQLGFRLNEQYVSQDGSFSFFVGDNQVVLMLFPESTFRGFTGNAVADSAQGTEVLFSLGANSRDEVDDLALKAERAGGTIFSKPSEQGGWLYGCGFADPDGHRWNALYMDMSKMPQG
ncbi:VOC family protein [Neobacillus massiliamazoniensis]|uniref:Glyoxalase/bleomycin resistance protein n=1 Tax=Neobacillus massiliamazoniensis TaxID=1499688 RepID=A0A0U1P3W8_9BACI|nr:VOC family protein [Neobacillus massiliamazoniensis]CRK84772.1 glyoxalase/bleomycin resistance protein [Neobacillus massiliamazoniensis]